MATKTSIWLQLWSMRYYILGGLIIIGILLFKYWDYKTSELAYKYPSVRYVEITKRVGNITIKNGEKIISYPNGKIEAFGKSLELSDHYEVSIIEKVKYTPAFQGNITAFCYWNVANLSYIPNAVGVSYAIARPLNIASVYDFSVGRVYLGIGLSF